MLSLPNRYRSTISLAAVIFLGSLAPPADLRAASPLQGQPAAVPGQLVIAMRVTDKQGNPVTDLKADEFEVLENGKARPITHAELDQRPLASAVIVDSGVSLNTEYQMTVVPAVTALVRALPPGTTVDVWTTGPRATRVAEGLTDAAAVESALKMTAPNGPNAVLDALVEASQGLSQPGERRMAVFVLTSAAMSGGGGRQIEAAIKQTSMRPSFYSLEMVIGEQDPRIQNALEYLAAHTGGYFERVLSTGALGGKVPRLVEMVNSQYRVAWQPGSDPRTTKLEFKVKRKGTKVLSAQRLSTAW